MLYFYIIFAVYLVVVSLIAIIVTRRDKKAAKKGNWRVKERTLILISALGGSLAMLVTMRACRHKTQHKKFMVGIPFIIVFQIAIIAGVIIFFRWYTGDFSFLAIDLSLNSRVG